MTQIGMESPKRRFRPKTMRKSARKILAVGDEAEGVVQIRFMSIRTISTMSTRPRPLLG